MIRNRCIILLILLKLSSQITNGETTKRLSPLDPHSHSRPDQVKVTRMKMVLTANFDDYTFEGYVDLNVEKVKDVHKLILDTNKLNIQSVQIVPNELKYKIINCNKTAQFGSKMIIYLPKDENKFLINIRYKTSPEATGLLWLTPEQTVGKKYPYLYSQFEYIEARSFVPCQDTPSSKIRYEAEITAPHPLKVLMSGKETRRPRKGVGRNKTSTYFFKQDIPVQTYLIALVIGNLEGRKIGPISTVYTEKESVDAAQYEFAETNDQLKAAIEICGPYVWGKYDLLVLPSSFPYGGMENPTLTFASPTLVAGDRSLTAVVGHEIAHSWSGNLVTNVNFEQLWLNEGFTTFLERKIVGRMQGKASEDLEAYIGLSVLKEEIEQEGADNPLTKLVANLTGIHPDNFQTRVPYEKGQIFLKHLEEVVGGPSKFEPFLKDYFNFFKYKSISTDDFKEYFLKKFKNDENVKNIDWNKWLYSPGMPPIIPKYDLSLLEIIKEQEEIYKSWNPEKNLTFPVAEDMLSTPQKIQFLQDIVELDGQPIKKLEIWNKAWNMSAVNAEIKSRWLRIGLKSGWKDIVQQALDFVSECGRMLLIRPVYRELYAWEEVRPKAIEAFNKNIPTMMASAVEAVKQDLHLV